MLLPLLQEVRVAVLAFHNRAGTLLVNSASSFKPPACHPYCLRQGCNNHGRVVAKSCAPGPGARERTVSRSGGAGVAAHDLRGAGAGGRGRGPGADDQPSGRRTFPSVLNARSPGMKPPRDSRLFACRAYTGRAAPSVPGNDKPTGLDHAGLDAGGARLRRARLGLCGNNQCVGCTRQFFTKSFLGDDAAVLARSGGEEPASPRHRAGVASMAWRTTRRFRTNAP